MAGHSISTTQINVLVVEDSAPVRGRVVGELRDLPEVGEVAEAGSKASALKALRSAAPDVVILDVQLPDGSGVDVLRAVRETGARTGVIIFSSLSSRALFDACAGLHPDFIFSKSANFEEVKAAVRLLADRHRSQQAPESAVQLPR